MASGLRTPVPRDPHPLFTTLISGSILGVLTVLTQVSFATLLFRGTLASHGEEGFLLTLAGAAIVSATMGLTASYPGTVGRPHELAVIGVAVLIANASARVNVIAPDADPFATAVVLMGLSTLAFGLFAFLLGLRQAGNLIRFLPYPVLGGFIAGSGALLLKGGLAVMLGGEAGALSPAMLLAPGAPILWLPGLAYALTIFVVVRRRRSWLTLPVFLVAGIACFHLVLLLRGLSPADAVALGALPGASAMPDGPALSAVGFWRQIRWGVVLGLLPGILSVGFIATLGTLMNSTAIEVTVGREIDLNRDLKAVGLANLLAALVGSPAGFHSLSATALSHRIGSRSRGTALVVAALCLATLLGGRGLVALIPLVVSGGLLVVLGLLLLADWLIDRRAYLSGTEFGVLVAILLFTLLAGWMAAMVLGLILAVLLFTFDYSRISAVRNVMTGRTRRSNVDRSEARSRILDERGDTIRIVCLQGHLFFGTAHSLLASVRAVLDHPREPAPGWLLIDLRLISGLDASAVHTFTRIRQICEARGVGLLFTSPSPSVRQLLERSRLLPPEGEGTHWFVDLDHGLEWCENLLLSRHDPGAESAPEGMGGWIEVSSPGDDRARQRLLGYLTPCTWDAGTTIIREGDPPTSLFFLVSGRVLVERNPEPPSGGAPGGSPRPAPIRLRTMDPGTCIGEISFYLQRPTTASVRTLDRVEALCLTRENLRLMEERDPAAAALLHRLVARRLGERLVLTNQLAITLAG